MSERLKLEDLEFEVLISEQKIQKRVAELGKQISEEYQGTVPIMVGVLNGAVHFMSDLIRA